MKVAYLEYAPCLVVDKRHSKDFPVLRLGKLQTDIELSEDSSGVQFRRSVLQCHPGQIRRPFALLRAQLFPNLGFVPRNKITGGVIISSSTDRTKSRAAQAFKKIIPSISRSDSAFAAFYHRIAARAGTGKAITATCRKLSLAFYNTIVLGQDYVEEGNKRYKERLADKEKKLLEKLAKKHNMVLSPVAC